MTQQLAHALAVRAAEVFECETSVEREGRFFVVAVEAPIGRYTLRDEADWDWLRRQLESG